MNVIIETRTFRIHQINGYICKIYIAEYPEALLLLDGGCSTDIPLIRSYVTRKLKRRMTDIRLVAVTHIHPDHAGGSTYFSHKKIPVAAPAGINDWYAGLGGFIQHKIDISLGYVVTWLTRAPIRSIWYSRRVRATVHLTHGDRLHEFSDWTAIATPGHTRHDLSFYHPETGILYAGDVLLHVNGRFNLPFPVTYPEAMADSITRLRHTPIKTALLAHGGAVSGTLFKSAALEAVKVQHRPQGGFIERIRPLAKFTPQSDMPTPRVQTVNRKTTPAC